MTHDIAPLTCIGDAFEWLVLMEILCFEEFECMLALSQLVPHVFGAQHSCQREFRLPGDLRFFLIHGRDAENRQRFRATDIVCIRSSIPLGRARCRVRRQTASTLWRGRGTHLPSVYLR